MNERTDSAERGWFDLGRYRVLAMALPTNEYFTTHHIFLRGHLIGRQISRPSLSDCQWHEAQQGVYATREQSVTPRGYSAMQGRRGRPTNAERARRAAMLPDEEPVS